MGEAHHDLSWADDLTRLGLGVDHNTIGIRQ